MQIGFWVLDEFDLKKSRVNIKHNCRLKWPPKFKNRFEGQGVKNVKENVFDKIAQQT